MSEEPYLKRLLGRRMDDVRERLVSGEEVIEVARISAPGLYWRSVVVFIFAVLIGLMIAPQLGWLFGSVAVLMFVHAAIKKEILLLVLTNKRILARYGLLQIDVVDLHFDKIESVELERMLPGYLMGYAAVVVMGTGNRYIAIPYVENGVVIRRAYNELTLGSQ